jgi:DNA-binding PadR family transcriptional regulator
MRYDDRAVLAKLPLPPATFHILVSLASADRHGYGIMQDVQARTDGALRLSAGTLYRTIQRLLDDRLITEVSKASASREDPRRRYYRITRFGTAVARADAERLAQLVSLAKGAGLLAGAS